MKAKTSPFARNRTGWLFLRGRAPLGAAAYFRSSCCRLCESRASAPPVGGLRRAPAQAAVARVLPPLREHEGVDLERGRDGLHLDPGLLTQPDRGELKLVAVAWTLQQYVALLPHFVQLQVLFRTMRSCVISPVCNSPALRPSQDYDFGRRWRSLPPNDAKCK